MRAIFIRRLVLMLSVLAIILGALMTFAATKFFWAGADPTITALGRRFLLCGAILIALGVWHVVRIRHGSQG